jgi:hypothetical protein
MHKNQKIEDEVKRTISVLDKIHNIDANPFLYTRIKAEINSGLIKTELKPYDVVLKLLSPIIVALLFIVNIYSVLSFLSNGNVTPNTRQSYMNNIKSEYSLDNLNDYLTNYENKE